MKICLLYVHRQRRQNSPINVIYIGTWSVRGRVQLISSLSSPSSFRREFPSSFCKSRERWGVSRVTASTWPQGEAAEEQNRGGWTAAGLCAGSQCQRWDQVTSQSPVLRSCFKRGFSQAESQVESESSHCNVNPLTTFNSEPLPNSWDIHLQ